MKNEIIWINEKYHRIELRRKNITIAVLGLLVVIMTAVEVCKPHKEEVKQKALIASPMNFHTEEEELAVIPEISINKEKKEVVQLEDRKLAYIKRFSSVAKAEELKYGIPASIKLAQGLIESNAGTSHLARNHNNHFGIKCFSKRCSKGHCTNHTDDSHKDFFRIYNTAWESYRAHSQFLQKKRYKPLFKLDKKDYKSWARGLKKAGYATDKKYAEKLIKVIEEYDLNNLK